MWEERVPHCYEPMRDVKVYQGPFYGQDPSPILGVQAKHITCIILMLTLVNLWLV